MNTYPEMNREICGILRISGKPTNAYAALRIEELETRVRELENLEKAVSNWLDEFSDISTRPTLEDVCRLRVRVEEWKKGEEEKCRQSCNTSQTNDCRGIRTILGFVARSSPWHMSPGRGR